MDKRTTGIVLTVVTILLCGCPGLISFCVGAMFTVVSMIPDANIDVFGSNDPAQALITGVVAVCIGIIFIVIPIVVGYLTLGRKEKVEFDEPIPPAI